MSIPRIGLPIGREDLRGQRFDATPTAYVATVLEAGGLPVLLPPLPVTLVPEALEGLSGIVLTGGVDVEPARYGAVAQPETEEIDPERDASELALVGAASARGLPILGICRGAQLLNVALGGTLHQHLSDSGGVVHLQGHRRSDPVHEVVLAPGSILALESQLVSLSVNSIHHQGIDRVGASLRAVGLSPDGIIEVLESDDGSSLAVQWHPECLPAGPARRAPFSWLIEMARHRAAASLAADGPD